MKILIAEDDNTSRRMLAAVLRKIGHAVVETVDGVQALAAMQAPDAPRMAVLDWMMPELDGLEVVRRIRALPTDCPPYLLMLTTKATKVDVAAALDAGADDYLVKPFDLGELRARISVGCRTLGLEERLAAKIDALQEAMAQIKMLRGIVPICAWCKKIRDDQGYWDQLETYISKHSEAQFSHGICPDCVEKMDRELDSEEKI